MPFALAIVPLLSWTMMGNLDERAFSKFTPVLGIITVSCMGILTYSLYTDYHIHTCDNQTLTIYNLISKKSTSINLVDIKHLRLLEKHAKNLTYHNIEVTHSTGTTILKGLYINEMIQFFQYLQEQTKIAQMR